MVDLETFRRQFNGLGGERLDELSEKVRRDLLGMCGYALKNILLQQLAEKEQVHVGEVLRYKVTSGRQANPANAEAPQDTMSIMVKNAQKSVTQREAQRLRIHIAVPDGFDSADREAVEALSVPGVIFPERYVKMKSGVMMLARYAITEGAAYEYPVSGRVEDRAALDGPWPTAERRPDPALPALTGIYEDLIAWGLAEQSTTIIGQPDITAL